MTSDKQALVREDQEFLAVFLGSNQISLVTNRKVMTLQLVAERKVGVKTDMNMQTPLTGPTHATSKA